MSGIPSSRLFHYWNLPGGNCRQNGIPVRSGCSRTFRKTEVRLHRRNLRHTCRSKDYIRRSWTCSAHLFLYISHIPAEGKCLLRDRCGRPAFQKEGYTGSRRIWNSSAHWPHPEVFWILRRARHAHPSNCRFSGNRSRRVLRSPWSVRDRILPLSQ